MKVLFSLLLCLCFMPRLMGQQIDNDQLLDLMQSQRYREAASLITSTYPTGISDPKIMARLAYCNFMAGNLPEAEKNYIRLFERDSTSKTILFNLASINYKRGNLIQSNNYYQKILKLDSTNFTVYKQLALLAERMSDKEKSFSYLGKANSLDPKEPDVAYDYSDLLRKAEEYNKADSVIQIALEGDTLNLLLIKGKMEISYKLKNYKTATEMAKRAIKLGDNSGQTLNILAQSFYFMKLYQKCIDTYNILEEQDMGNETTFYYTALAYRRLHKSTKSIEYLNKSISDGISDNITVYYHELAIDYETLKSYKRSIASYKKAADFKANNAHNYNIARIYDTYFGDKTNAERYYRFYIKNYKPERSEKELYAYAIKRLKEF